MDYDSGLWINLIYYYFCVKVKRPIEVVVLVKCLEHTDFEKSKLLIIILENQNYYTLGWVDRNIPFLHISTVFLRQSLMIYPGLARNSLCRLGWLQLRNLPASSSQVLGLKMTLCLAPHFFHILNYSVLMFWKSFFVTMRQEKI